MSALPEGLRRMRRWGRAYGLFEKENLDGDFVREVAAKHGFKPELITSGEYSKPLVDGGYVGLIELNAKDERFRVYVAWKKDAWWSYIVWKDEGRKNIETFDTQRLV